MSFTIERPASGCAFPAGFSATGDSAVHSLVGDIARLALSDPAHAASIVRGLVASGQPDPGAALAAAVAGQLDDPCLQALVRTPAGRELLGALDHGHPFARLDSDQQAQVDRIRDAFRSAPSVEGGGTGARFLDGTHARFQAAALSAPCRASPDAAATENVKGAFKQEFAAKAADKEGFHAFMKDVFGDKHDVKLAEQFRQRALAGDFSWLPDVKFVDASTLRGANGAYNAQEGVVYINRDMAASDPAKAAQTYVEEAGHHLDAKLNQVDAKGDEGEMFRRILSGEKLSAQQVADIRSDDDHGTITVDGKQVDVEFWGFSDLVDGVVDLGTSVVDKAKEAVEAVANTVVDGVSTVAQGAADGAKAIGSFASDAGGGIIKGIGTAAQGVVGAVKDVGHGLLDATGGFLVNAFNGHFGEALSSVVRGADRAIFQSTERFYSGVIDGFKDAADGITDGLGSVGKPIRKITDRVFDIGHTALDTAFGMARDVVRIVPDTVTGFVSDVERAVKFAADGHWDKAAKQFGMAFVNSTGRAVLPFVDLGARFLQGSASAVQTAIGGEPPARALSPKEREYLEAIYGDAVDYDMVRVKERGWLNNAMTPHTVGNTVYLPKGEFDLNGNLTPEGLHTLGHEVGHVWQNQNGGGDYIHGALGAQQIATVTTGSWTNAYHWQDALKDGETFESMNAEEQAHVMEDIGIALQNDGMITTADKYWTKDDKGKDVQVNYTSDEAAFLREVADKLKWGEGAG